MVCVLHTLFKIMHKYQLPLYYVYYLCMCVCVRVQGQTPADKFHSLLSAMGGPGVTHSSPGSKHLILRALSTATVPIRS